MEVILLPAMKSNLQGETNIQGQREEKVASQYTADRGFHSLAKVRK
jgi:hypothetical protein